MKQVRPPRAVDAAAAAVRAGILAGEYPIDSRLPPEPALAELLGISRLTLRAAIAQLEAEHLLRAEHGTGVRVLDFRRTAGIELLEHLVEQHGLSDAGIELIASFLELRRALAAEAVALACHRCTEEQLRLLRLLADQQRAETDPDAFEERDVEFARAIVQAAGSPAMELLLNSIERLRNAHPELLDAMRAQREASRETYHWILQVIVTGEQEGTRQAVCQLLEPIDADIIAALRRTAKAGRTADAPRSRRSGRKR